MRACIDEDAETGLNLMQGALLLIYLENAHIIVEIAYRR